MDGIVGIKPEAGFIDGIVGIMQRQQRFNRRMCAPGTTAAQMTRWLRPHCGSRPGGVGACRRRR